MNAGRTWSRISYAGVGEVFASFENIRVETQDATINALYGGGGPPILLLHGYPQTHAMWHLVAPRLAERFTVVATFGDTETARSHLGVKNMQPTPSAPWQTTR